MDAPKTWSKEWWKAKIPGGGFIGDITGAIETNLAKASRFILLVDLGYAGYRAITHTTGAAHASSQGTTLDAIWLVSQILAFDLSAPGLERIAREAETRGDKKTADSTRATKWAGIVLASLTFVEMGLIQLNWFPEYLPVFSFFLMVGRGVASVMVLNFSGIDQHTPIIETPTARPAAPSIDDLYEKLLERLKADMNKQLIQQSVSNVRITEDTQSGHVSNSMSAPAEQKADMAAIPERTPDTGQTKQADMNEGTPDTIPAKQEDTATPKAATEPDKLQLTIEFLREHPGSATDENTDAQLADVLGLKRPASARFWRLKAIELIQKEAPAANTEQGAYNKLLAYAHSNPQRTQKELASILGVSERTMRRNLKQMRESGQLPANWIVEPDMKADTGQQSGHENTGPASIHADIEMEAERTPDTDIPLLRVVK